MLPLNLNGYTDLPPGKVASIVTYLEMKERPRLKRLTRPVDWRFENLSGDPDRYRALFRRIGEPWLWFSRVLMPAKALSGIIDDPDVAALALVDDTQDLGLLELDFRRPDECELSFFGVIPEKIGSGAGRFLMNEAIRRAFRQKISRFFVHTCSLDHPAALSFYRRSGFVPYRQAIEVADDPRLKGLLPRDAAPQVPVFPLP